MDVGEWLEVVPLGHVVVQVMQEVVEAVLVVEAVVVLVHKLVLVQVEQVDWVLVGFGPCVVVEKLLQISDVGEVFCLVSGRLFPLHQQCEY